MTRGMVAAGDKRTADAGAAMIALGGNAADAAVAAAFASFVAEGTVVNLGGGGFGLVVAPQHDPVAYDFFAGMPTGVPQDDMDFHEILVDFGTETQSFHIGRAATAVPGAVAGLCHLAAEWGTLPLTTLLQPAVDLARNGFTVPRNMALILHLLRDIYQDTPQAKALFWGPKGLKTAGEPIRFPHLADTLERLAAEGADYFYKGALAAQIVADHQQHGGLITADDLVNFKVARIEPIVVPYRGDTVLLTPAPSHGGVLLALSLRLLANCPLAPGSQHPEHLITLALVMKVTGLARAAWEKEGGLLLKEENIARWQQVLQQALAGDPLPDPAPSASGPGHTTHISAVDRHGMAVSITTSAGESAGYVVGNTGVCLNNILGEADLNPLGWHQHPPGSRLSSMMCPTVVMRHGTPLLTLGSAGSNRIRSAILQTICNVLHFNMAPQAAIDAPRMHFENGVLQCEGGIDDAAADALAAAGFKLSRWDERNLFFGGAQAIVLDVNGMTGGADPRRNGAVREG